MAAVLNGGYTGHVPRREGDGDGPTWADTRRREFEQAPAQRAARAAYFGELARRWRGRANPYGVLKVADAECLAIAAECDRAAAGAPTCSPCSQQCNQGRACPARSTA